MSRWRDLMRGCSEVLRRVVHKLKTNKLFGVMIEFSVIRFYLLAEEIESVRFHPFSHRHA